MDTVCQRNALGPIAPHCAAFQVSRITACIGLFLLVVAATCLASAFAVTNRGFAAVGGLASALGALAMVVATSVFYAHQMGAGAGLGVDGLASIGYSFWLVMAAAPLALLAAVGACAAASVFIGAKEYDVDLTSLGWGGGGGGTWRPGAGVDAGALAAWFCWLPVVRPRCV